MCNLYHLNVSGTELHQYFKAQNDFRNEVEVTKDYVAPGVPSYVVRQDEGQRVLSSMLWGFPTRKPRVRAPKEGQSPHVTSWWTNARELEKPIWRNSCLTVAQRCLVPFSDFTEPKAAKDRADPRDLYWYFNIVDRPVAAFAGLWKVDPVEGRVFAFCTTEPNPMVAAVHPKAMPVILDEGYFDRWLNADWEDAQGLVTAYPSQLMTMA